MSDDLEVGKCPYCGGDMIQTEEDGYCCEDCDYCEARMVFIAERDENSVFPKGENP